MFLTFASAVTFYVIVRYILLAKPPAIHGVYTQPSRIHKLKYWFFYWVLSLRKWRNSMKTNVSGEGAGYGMRSRSTPEDMDKAQTLDPNHPKAVDAVYFNGGNTDGYYMVAATARRHDKLVQTLLYIRIPGRGLLKLPALPESAQYTDREDAFTAAGLELTVVDAMKKWKLKYKGKMTLISHKDGSSSEVDVHFDVDWIATSAYFDFDTDLDVSAMADSIAREPWSQDFFDRLKKAHQTHYEQFGEMAGTIHIGQESVDIKVQGIRDHSYGNVRDWSDLHRYAIQYAYLEDGTSICIGNICMKPTMTRLIIGYVFHPDGRMTTVSSTDLELHTLGEDGRDADDMTLSFISGGKTYNVTCHVEECAIFYMGLDWDARIHERMCTYVINGQRGWGISEWDYCNKAGKGNIYKRI